LGIDKPAVAPIMGTCPAGRGPEKRRRSR